MSRRGRVIASDDVGEGGGAVFSPNGRYVTSAQRAGKGFELWVADVTTGRVFYRRAIHSEDVDDVQWKGDRKVAVSCSRGGTYRSVTYTVAR
jgi:WD40 repeat protein